MPNRRPLVVYVCKHCKIHVVSPTDFRPIPGETHKPNCPRKKMYG